MGDICAVVIVFGLLNHLSLARVASSFKFSANDNAGRGGSLVLSFLIVIARPEITFVYVGVERVSLHISLPSIRFLEMFDVKFEVNETNDIQRYTNNAYKHVCIRF